MTRAALQPCAPRDTRRRHCAHVRQSHAWRLVGCPAAAACCRPSRCPPAGIPYLSSLCSSDIADGATKPASLPDFAVTLSHSPEYGSRLVTSGNLLRPTPVALSPIMLPTPRRRRRFVGCSLGSEVSRSLTLLQ